MLASATIDFAWILHDQNILQVTEIMQIDPKSSPSYYMDGLEAIWRQYQIEETSNKKCGLGNGPFCGFLDNQLAENMQTHK